MEAGVPIDLLLPVVIALMMLAVGMGLRPGDFRAVAAAPLAAVLGFVGMFVVFPLLAFAVAAAFRLEPALAIGLVLLAASPSASTSTMFTYLARGDVALSVALTSVSKVVPVATVPAYVSLAAQAFAGERLEVEISFAETSEAIVTTILLPTIAGMALGRYVPGAAAWRPYVTRVSVLLLVVLIGVLAFRERTTLPGMFASSGLAALTLCVLGMASAFAAASIARLSRGARSALTIELGMQSGGTSIAIAAGVLAAPAMAVPAAVYSLIMYVAAAAFVLLERSAEPGAAPDVSRAVR
ncbi:MAG TPA: bile acid:sodium symporter [Gammaproteobacteria bacterium]